MSKKNCVKYHLIDFAVTTLSLYLLFLPGFKPFLHNKDWPVHWSLTWLKTYVYIFKKNSRFILKGNSLKPKVPLSCLPRKLSLGLKIFNWKTAKTRLHIINENDIVFVFKQSVNRRKRFTIPNPLNSLKISQNSVFNYVSVNFTNEKHVDDFTWKKV